MYCLFEVVMWIPERISCSSGTECITVDLFMPSLSGEKPERFRSRKAGELQHPDAKECILRNGKGKRIMKTTHLFVMMLVFLCAVCILPVAADTVTVVSYEELKSNISSASTEPRTIEIGADISFDNLTIDEGRNITLQPVAGESYTLSSVGDEPFLLIVEADSNLTLAGNGGGNLTLDNMGSFFTPVCVSGGRFTLIDGIIQNSNTHGVFVSDGTFRMHGGVITDNWGSGVNVWSVSHNSTFLMTGGVITGNGDAEVEEGGGVRVGSSDAAYRASFLMTGGEISGNTAKQGGGVFMKDGAQGVILGNISGNSASVGGGVFLKDDARGVILGNITGNTAEQGGGIEVNASSLVFGFDLSSLPVDASHVMEQMPGFDPSHLDGLPSPVTFLSDNEATLYGGGIHVVDGSRLLMAGGTITNNTAPIGAGVDVYDGSVLMFSGKITNNTATGSDTEDPEWIGMGGGVHLLEESSFIMAGGSITDNKAEGGSGMHISNTSHGVMSAGEIRNNTASIWGGGVSVDAGSDFTLSGGEITGNTAPKGAGLDFLNADFEMTGGEIAGNIATGDGTGDEPGMGGGVYSQEESFFVMSGGNITGNIAEQGGGVFLKDGVRGIILGNITGNCADQGAGIEVDASSLIFGADPSLLPVDPSHISEYIPGFDPSHISEYIPSFDPSHISEYIPSFDPSHITEQMPSFDPSHLDDLQLPDALLSDNYATAYGGGIHVVEGMLLMTGGTITNNTAPIGAGVDVYNGSMLMASGNISGNTATGGDTEGSSTGGGVHLLKESNFIMVGGSIADNKAEGGSGVHFAEDSRGMMISGEVRNNTASIWGGGVSVYSSNLIIINGTITNNTAPRGAGLDLLDSSAIMMGEDALITDNTAERRGGGVSVNESRFGMAGGRISGNNASVGGGGISLKGTSSEFVMTAGEIIGNIGPSNGILNRESTMTVSGSAVIADTVNTTNPIQIGGDFTGPGLIWDVITPDIGAGTVLVNCNDVAPESVLNRVTSSAGPVQIGDGTDLVLSGLAVDTLRILDETGEDVPEDVTFINGETYRYTVETYNATTELSVQIVYTISDPTVLTWGEPSLEPGINLLAVAPGSAHLTVYGGGIEKQVNVTIVVPTSILVTGFPNGGVVDLYTDKPTGNLTALVMDQTGTPISGEEVDWISSNTTVLTIDEDGNYAAHAIGSAVVTATAKIADSVQTQVPFFVTNTTPITPVFNPTEGTTPETPVPPAGPQQIQTTVTIQGVGTADATVTITPVKEADIPTLPDQVPVIIALEIDVTNLQPASGGQYTFTFTLPRAEISGKVVKVQHYSETENKWNDCHYTVEMSGDVWTYTVYTDSFSPFAVTAASPVVTDNGGSDNGAELLASVGVKPTVSPVKPTTSPVTPTTSPATSTVSPETETTQPTASTTPGSTGTTQPETTTPATPATTGAPAPLAGLLAGLGAAGVLLRKLRR